MIRPTTRSTSTDTLFPYTTLLRSQAPCPGPRLRGAFPLRLERTWPRRLVALAGAEADARGVRAAARHARRLHADPLPRPARRGCDALQSNRQLHGRPVHGMAGPAPGAVPAQDGLDRFGLTGGEACRPRPSPSCIAH